MKGDDVMKKIVITIVLLLTAVVSGCSTGRVPEINPFLLDVFPPNFQEQHPTAKANIKYRQVKVGDQLQFDASNSISRVTPNGLSYTWQVIEKPPQSQAQFAAPHSANSAFTIDAEGLYLLQLSVTDAQSNEDQFEIALSTNADDLKQSGFIAMADFGTGTDAEYRLGQALVKLCQEKRCDFVVGLGNNIEPKGIVGTNDGQLKDKFDKPFADLNIPFYLVLGDRDTLGVAGNDGVLNIYGDAQVDYARWRRKPTLRWQMPARYYRINVPLPDMDQQPLADIYALDTTLLVNSLDKLSRYKLHEMYQQQGAWLDNQQSLSHAQWQIAFAHHAYLSNGKHGDAGKYDNKGVLGNSELSKRISGGYVKEFVEEHICKKVDLYLAAHDNTLQYLKPTERCGDTEFVVSGAGAKSASIKGKGLHPNYWQMGDAHGFFYIEMIAQRMTIAAYTVNEQSSEAELQFERTVYR